MSRTIDERVVEMRFDNKQFESGVKETMGTLDKLKRALNMSTSEKSLENLDKAANSISLAGILSGVDQLNKRFSTMGIVGMRVVQNLTDAMMNKLAKAVSFVDDAIVSGGVRRAMNIENAHFQLQALLKDESEVQRIMGIANESVTGTAYAYDEAAKAASQFAASGVRSNASLTQAMMGLVGVAAMTNSEYEGISRIFTTVAGNGRLMGDQLLQLSSRGLNAAATLSDYFNKVNSGAVEATDNVKAQIKSVSEGVKVTEADIREFVSEGKISFDIFASAMNDAFGESAKKANDTFTGSFSNMKAALARIGAEFVSPLVAQNSEVVLLFNALKDRINDVKKALTFSEELGNVNALSKQVTDFILSLAKATREYVTDFDLTKPFEAFYHTVEGVKNVFKGLLDIAEPIGRAFKEVFLSVSLYSRTFMKPFSDFEILSKRFRLTAEGAQNLHDIFEALFRVGKLVGSVFVNIVKALLPINPPIVSLNEGILQLTGDIARCVIAFTKWVEKNKLITKAFDNINKVLGTGIYYIGRFLASIGYYIKEVSQLPIVNRAFEALSDVFQAIGRVAMPILNEIVDRLGEFGSRAFEAGVVALNSIFASFVITLENVSEALNNLDLSDVTKWFDNLGESLKNLLRLISGTEGFNTFVQNAEDFMKRLSEAFTADNLAAKIDATKSVLGGFMQWLGDIFGPFFSDLTVGSVIGGASGLGIVYSFLKLSGAFEKISDTIGSFKKIPDFFGSMQKILDGYQRDLNASAIIKIAGAIAILGAALTVMSFADPGNLMVAAVALSSISAVLLFGFAKLKEVIKRAPTITDATMQVAKGLKSALKNLGRALVIKSLGTAVKDFGKSMAYIAASIISLGLMYRKDPEAMAQAVSLVKWIGIFLAGAVVVGSVIGQFLGRGMRNFARAATSVAALGVALYLIVGSVNKLFKLTIPSDYEKRMDILADLFKHLMKLTLVTAAASLIAGGEKLKSGPILAVAGTLYIIVASLEKLFNMKLPEDSKDFGIKIAILVGIFIALESLILTIGIASRLAQGSIKATGTILAVCAFIGTIVASLMVLSITPWQKLAQGAVALGGILLTLGAALYGAGQITKPDVYKSVLAMSVAIGAITASLSILALIPLPALAKAGVTLGVLLYTLSKDLQAAGSATNPKSWVNIMAMCAAILVIALSLDQLATHPWDRLLAAGASVSATLLAFAGAFYVIDKANPDPTSIAAFAVGVVGIAGIAYSLFQLAKQPWKNVEVAGDSISKVLLSMTVAMGICALVGNFVGPALSGIALLDAFIANFALVLIALGALSNSAGSLMSGGMSLLEQVGTSIGNFAGNIIRGLGGGIADALVSIGEGLSDFTDAARPFFLSLRTIDEEALAGVTNLAKVFVILTANDILRSITDWFTGGNPLEKFGIELENFAPHIAAFAKSITNVNMSAVEGAAAATLIMAKCAENLPPTEGLSEKIFGKRRLSEFGEELKGFGPNIASFAEQVKDVNPAAVEGAAAAAKIMGECAKNLPATDGFAQKVFGKHSLSEFGEQLKVFGPYIASFAEQVKDVKPEAVEGAAAAGEIMAKLSEKLQSSGGILEFFTGKKDLGTFGQTLITFGQGIKGFSDEVSGVAVEAIQNLVTGMDSLLDLATKASEVDAYSLVNFVNTLGQMGYDGITALVDALNDKDGRISASISALVVKIQNGVNSNQPKIATSMRTLGTAMVTELSAAFTTAKVTLVVTTALAGVLTGINTSKPKITTAVRTLCVAITNQMKTSLPNTTFSTIGKNVVGALANGLSYSSSASTAARNAANSVITAFQSILGYNSFYNIGSYAAQGLAAGIRSQTYQVSNSAYQVAQTAANAARNALRVQSPSRVFFEIGQYVSLGLANGIVDYIGTVVDASKRLGDESVSASANALSEISRLGSDIFSDDLMPVITPRVDLTQAEQSARQLAAMFNEGISQNYQSAASISSNFVGNSEQARMNQLLGELSNLFKIPSGGDMVNIQNEFHVETNDPEEFAEKVGYILQKQVERKEAVWG